MIRFEDDYNEVEGVVVIMTKQEAYLLGKELSGDDVNFGGNPKIKELYNLLP